MDRIIVDARSCNVLQDLIEHARLIGVRVLVFSPFELKLHEKHPGAFYDVERGCVIGDFGIEQVEIPVDSEGAARPLWWVAGEGDVVVADDVLFAATGMWNGASAVDFRGQAFYEEGIDELLKQREACRRGRALHSRQLPKIDKDSVKELFAAVDSLLEGALDATDGWPRKGSDVEAKILVDADNIPLQPVLSIARRHGCRVAVAHNGIMRVEKQLLFSDPTCEDEAAGGYWVQLVPCSSEKDAADHWIVDHANAGDVVLTTDVLLMWECLGRGATVIDRLGCSYESDDRRYFENCGQMRTAHRARYSCAKETLSKPQKVMSLMTQLDDRLSSLAS